MIICRYVRTAGPTFQKAVPHAAAEQAWGADHHMRKRIPKLPKEKRKLPNSTGKLQNLKKTEGTQKPFHHMKSPGSWVIEISQASREATYTMRWATMSLPLSATKSMARMKALFVQPPRHWRNWDATMRLSITILKFSE